MHSYLYDGSFDGLLTVWFCAYRDTEVLKICRQSDYQPDLLSQPLYIETQTDKAARITRSVYERLSADTMRNLYILYLSELPDCDLLGLQYLHLCYESGASINRAKHHPIIRRVDDIRQKVLKEYDHMRGFLRFQKLNNGVYYGRFAPDHNQLPLLMPHFQKRFSDQQMLIYDKKRSCAALFNDAESVMIPFTAKQSQQLLDSCEDTCYLLFRQYFQSITITERSNLRLQAQYLPHRYRTYMPETQPQ